MTDKKASDYRLKVEQELYSGTWKWTIQHQVYFWPVAGNPPEKEEGRWSSLYSTTVDRYHDAITNGQACLERILRPKETTTFFHYRESHNAYTGDTVTYWDQKTPEEESAKAKEPEEKPAPFSIANNGQAVRAAVEFLRGFEPTYMGRPQYLGTAILPEAYKLLRNIDKAVRQNNG